MSIKIFLSAVSDEFSSYRDQLRHDLTRHNVEVKVQEDFKDLGDDTLDKLDRYIAACDAVVHLIGEMCGSLPGERELAALLRKHRDLASELPPLADALRMGEPISYTQWEAWLALYHDKLLLTVSPFNINEICGDVKTTARFLPCLRLRHLNRPLPSHHRQVLGCAAESRVA
jgi:Domain of unknown function (DUF4062)